MRVAKDRNPVPYQGTQKKLPEEFACRMKKTRPTGTSRPAPGKPDSASSRSSQRPTTPLWSPRAFPCSAESASAGCRTCRSPRGSAPAPAGTLNPEKHMYEEIFLVVEGRGTTEVWLEGDAKRHVFEWQKGSMFSIPMNAWHRIVNATPGGALLLAGTTAPNVLNMINNVDAVFNNPFVFRERFSGADDFFKPKDDIEPDPVRGLAMRRTNFIPDIVNCDLPLDNRRSPGWRRVEPFMTDNCFYFWIGQHENGRYSKGHAHTSAAVLICVKGKGYTYTWPERIGVTPWKDGRMSEVKRVDYEPVGMVSAAPGGARWYHQHFSVSKDPFRLTAWFGPHNPGRDPGPPGEKHTDYTAIDIPDGGTSIPYWMEDPYIRKEYDETLKKNGVPNRMEPGWYVAPAAK